MKNSLLIAPDPSISTTLSSPLLSSGATANSDSTDMPSPALKPSFTAFVEPNRPMILNPSSSQPTALSNVALVPEPSSRLRKGLPAKSSRVIEAISFHSSLFGTIKPNVSEANFRNSRPTVSNLAPTNPTSAVPASTLSHTS